MQKFFIYTGIIFLFGLGWWFFFASSLNSRHESIIQFHENHLNKLDSINSACLATLTDSATLNKLSPTERLELVKSVNAAITNDANKIEYENIKELLTLEFNKIQNEYETLTLWGGILTVVFLIFSFYSLFKTENLHSEAKDSLQNLRNIKIEAQKEKDSIEEQSNAVIKTLTDKLNVLTDQLEVENKKYIDAAGNFYTSRNTTLEEIEKSKNETLDIFKKEIANYRKSLNDLQRTFKVSNSEFGEAYESRLTKLENKIDLFISSKMTPEEINELFKDWGNLGEENKDKTVEA